MGGFFGGSSAQSTSQSETPLTGLNIQSSSRGLPITLVYGTTRVSPNIIWYGDFRAIPHTTTQSQSGGKGGGSATSTNTTYTYNASFALALCEGEIKAITTAWVGKTKVSASSLFSLFLGAIGQQPWSYLSGSHPGEAIGYSGIAYVAANGYDLGSSASLPNHSFEVQGKFLLNGSLDADPKDIISDLLTSKIYGVPGDLVLGDLTQFSNYCKASGILLSPEFSEPAPAANILTDLMTITNTGIYFSEGKIKLVPYGDSVISGNGVTYTPAIDSIQNLNDDDYLGDETSDPIIIKRNAVSSTVATSQDAFNQVSVEYLDRSNDYTIAVVTVEDQANIEQFGLRPMPTIKAHQIADGSIANTVASLILQRSVYVRATYEFRLGWQYCYLEPTDFLTLTDSALGLLNHPVRVLQIEEDEYGTLSVLAEDAPYGVYSHVVATPPSNRGYSVDYNAEPGDVSAVCIFEPPFELCVGSGLEVWAGVSGPVDSNIWGGCNVWVSYDGVTYKKLTTIDNPARLGHLTGNISNSATSLNVVLDGMGGQLLSASHADAQALNTLLYVGGANPEFMAYEGATLTGANAYGLSGLVRGAYGSSEASHFINDPFIRIDESLAKSGSLDLSFVGSTIHFKFQSFNIWGGGEQDLSALTSYHYVISGQQATGNAVSGLTATAVAGSDTKTKLSWNASPGADHYIVDQSGDGITWLRTGETKDTTWADSALFGAQTRFRVASVRALAGSWSSNKFLNINYIGMWNANPNTQMWNANSATPMWSK